METTEKERKKKEKRKKKKNIIGPRYSFLKKFN